MATVNIALIGCGGYGSGYARELAESQKARLAVACDTNREHAETAARMSGATVCAEWGDALRTPGLNGAIIATPNHLHAPITFEAAALGLHVLCEKPMATSLHDARQMVEACRAAGTALMIGLSSRYDRAYRAAHDLAYSGTLGRPLLIADVYRYTLAPAQPDRVWHNDPQLMGGGALIQMGIHSLDRVLWMAGAEPTRVWAQTLKGGGRWSDNMALCQIAFADDTIGYVEIAGVASAPHCELTLHLTGGQIVASRGALRWYDGEWHEETYQRDHLASEVRDFCRAISEGAQPSCSGDAALPAHELCFAAYRSSDEERALARANGEFV